MALTQLRQWPSTVSANLKDPTDQDQVRFADLDLNKKINQVAGDANADAAYLNALIFGIEEITNQYGSYTKFPSGILIQRGWGYMTGTGGGWQDVTFTLPCAFLDLEAECNAWGIGIKQSGAAPTSRQDVTIPRCDQQISSCAMITTSTARAHWFGSTLVNTHHFLFSFMAIGRWK